MCCVNLNEGITIRGNIVVILCVIFTVDIIYFTRNNSFFCSVVLRSFYRDRLTENKFIHFIRSQTCADVFLKSLRLHAFNQGNSSFSFLSSVQAYNNIGDQLNFGEYRLERKSFLKNISIETNWCVLPFNILIFLPIHDGSSFLRGRFDSWPSIDCSFIFLNPRYRSYPKWNTTQFFTKIHTRLFLKCI